MDFSVIFQIRTKKFWWMDVIFYFVVSLLVATVLCYGIFWLKNSWQRQEIQTESLKFGNVGTDEQRKEEADVISYQKKINDFTGLFKNHEFASNVFAFMQTQTIPNVWFKQFSLDEKGGTVQLSGESDNLDSLSRQISVLEKNKYVTNVGNLNSSLGDNAKVEFNVSIILSQNIFNYLSDMTAVLQPPSAPAQLVPSIPGIPVNPGTAQNGNVQQLTATQSNQKLITVFDFAKPAVSGIVDESKFTITLNVPSNTNVKSLSPSIDVSPLATVYPASNVPEDFTNPIVYTVTAQDGSTQTYQVTVRLLPSAASKANKSSAGLIVVIIVIIIIIVVAIAIVALFVVRNRRKKSAGF